MKGASNRKPARLKSIKIQPPGGEPGGTTTRREKDR